MDKISKSDEIVRAISGDGSVKLTAIYSRYMVERARAIHNTAPTATAALGRTLSATAMLGEMLKEDAASVTVRINGRGEIGSIICVSDSSGNARGYVQNPAADPPRHPNGKLNVGLAVGTDGMLSVSRDFGYGEPYIGATALVSGEIAEDFTAYLAESEQQGCACALGVLVNGRGVLAAGGYIATLLPGAPEDAAERLERNIGALGTVTETLSSGTVDDLIAAVLDGFEPRVLERIPVEYRCTCSRERVLDAIAAISPEERAEITDADELTEVSCQFCDAVYNFEPHELD